ncbi:hypothetical protein V1514DRAFT_320817 [Lipomyces japonicus]|uniref:uncharacterized protein n=1 Tax=Lipomyces japonicus TaxID=56871 RepID=UPI0034CF7548
MSFYGPIQHRDQVNIQTDEAFHYLSDLNPVRNCVYIHHPGCDEKTDLLFRLYAPDYISGGIHFSLLMDACAIFANNRNDGWLATDRGGLNRVKPQPEDVLASGHYWYHLPRKGRQSAKWPVVTCFEDWKFPSVMPSLWAKVPEPDHFYIHVAHIITPAESEWFFRNRMSRWNYDYLLPAESLLEDQGNLMLLRSDVHAAFDNHAFVL